MPDTPDTLGYLILGLIVTFGVLGGFVALIAARWRALRRDLHLLENLRHDDGQQP
ncbi:MAG: hypothetical protein ACUVS2_01990 [Candidatus Flexifilum sp.]|jgi:hypothetical protein